MAVRSRHAPIHLDRPRRLRVSISHRGLSRDRNPVRTHALNPVRFLVVPRIIATLVSMTLLGVIADAVSVVAAMFTAMKRWPHVPSRAASARSLAGKWLR